MVNSFPSGISYDFMHSKSFTSDDLIAASEFISTSYKSKVKYEEVYNYQKQLSFQPIEMQYLDFQTFLSVQISAN